MFVEIANFPIYLFFLIMNGVKLSQRRFRPDIRENFFTVRVVKHWNRLPTEVVVALFLAVLKRHLDDALNNLL